MDASKGVLNMRILYPVIVVATLGIYAGMLVWSLPELAGQTQGLPVFDLRFSYTFEQARAVLAALGPTGRAFYLGPQHWLDTLFPGLEALSLTLTFRRLFAPRLAGVLGVVAVLGAGADYLENAGVSVMLRLGPGGITPEHVALASRWTSLKFVFVSIALSALLFGLGRALWRQFARR